MEIQLPNIIRVAMTAAMWDTAPTAKGVWDLQVTNVDGQPRTYVAGKVFVTADVTVSV